MTRKSKLLQFPKLKPSRPLSPLAAEAKEHLKEFRPKQYREMKKAGTLDEYVELLACQAKHALDSALASGLAHDQARELARDLYLLPDEDDVPDLMNNPYLR